MDEQSTMNGAPWRVSSHSAAQENTCVEIAPLSRGVGVRDTKDRSRGHVTVDRPAWTAFLAQVTRGTD